MDMFSVGLMDQESVFAIGQLAAMGGHSMIDIMDTRIDMNEKMTGLSFKPIQERKLDQRRIEFRYIGGKDYHRREGIIEWSVHRFAYAMMAAFSDKMLKKEFLREINKFLDFHTKKHFGEDLKIKRFADLKNIVRRYGIDSVGDLYSLKVIGEL